MLKGRVWLGGHLGCGVTWGSCPGSNIADMVASFEDTTTEVANQLDPARSNIADRATSPGDTTTEVATQPDSALRHLALKQRMLLLTNQEREKNGVPPVRLGTNPAAQLHAEAALENCYGGHWDQWGLKPNHRYTLTGGTGAEGENGSGLRYCIKSSRQLPERIESMATRK